MRTSVLIKTLYIALVVSFATPVFAFQASASPATTTQPASSSKNPAHVRRHKRTATQTIPMETETPPSQQSVQMEAAKAAQQRAADQRLLQQQQAESDKAAQINDQTVRQAERQQNLQQKEVRIQDAPGPAQTGVVPGTNQPLQPVPTDQRIQDAPSTQPTQLTPNTTPASPPQM